MGTENLIFHLLMNCDRFRRTSKAGEDSRIPEARRMACRFLITLYLLVVKVVADTKATKCQFFGLPFGVSSGLCLLFTFRLYQCFRKVFIGFSETLFFQISILLLHSLLVVIVRLLLFIDLML